MEFVVTLYALLVFGMVGLYSYHGFTLYRLKTKQLEVLWRLEEIVKVNFPADDAELLLAAIDEEKVSL
jgi:hypothetical protein